MYRAASGALVFGAGTVQGPCLDTEGANGPGIYCLQLPVGAEAQYKLDAPGTNI